MKRMIATLLVFVLCAAAFAQVQPADEIRQSYLEQNLGAQVPEDASFVDENGRNVRLGDYLGYTPALLVLGYFTCPDLCPMTFRHLTEELNGIGPVAGRGFQVIIISFDPRDTPDIAALQKQSCLRAYKWPMETAGWHFLTGKKEAAEAVARAVGFHYTFDQTHGKFCHPTGVMVLTPGGKLSHYFFGIDASPADIEAALHDAAAGRSTAVDQPDQQYCVDYDPRLSARGKIVTRIVDGGCIVWAAILFGYIGYKLVGEFHRRGSGVKS